MRNCIYMHCYSSKSLNFIFIRFILTTFSFRWSAIFLAMMSHLFTIRDNKGLYTKVAPLLNIFQTAAILEVSLTKMLSLVLKFTL